MNVQVDPSIEETVITAKNNIYVYPESKSQQTMEMREYTFTTETEGELLMAEEKEKKNNCVW